MAYQLNKTDGTLLVELVDGTIDTESTDITLVGRNYSGFGEFINENFIKMLENFANSTTPNFPLKGQLWYDSSEGRLKIFDGNDWIPAAAPFVQNTQPNNLNLGDFWIDDYRNQLYFYDGSDLVLAGPIYSTVQGKSGFEVQSITDNTGRSKTVVLLNVAGNTVAVISNEEFNLPEGSTVAGLSETIRNGINIIDSNAFELYGVVENARNLQDETGASRAPSQFLPADRNGVTTGTLGIANDGGLTIGLADNIVFDIKDDLQSDQVQLRTQVPGQDFTIISQNDVGPFSSVFIDTNNRYFGLFTSQPEKTLDVNGDTIIRGNLTVEGQQTYLNVTNLYSQDKNIELGLLDGDDSSVSEGTNADVDNAGLIIRSSEGSKDWTWKNSTKSWTANQNIDIKGGNWLKFNGAEILNGTTLKNVTSAPSLVNIGTLSDISIDNILLDGSRITVGTGYNLQLDSIGGSIQLITQQKITNVAQPTDDQDVATKKYVDDEIESRDLFLSLDITGLGENDIVSLLNYIVPIYEGTPQIGGIQRISTGTRVRLFCVDSGNTVVSGISFQTADENLPGHINRSFTDVADYPNYLASKSVMFDLNISDAEGQVTVDLDRELRTYEVQPETGGNPARWLLTDQSTFTPTGS